MFGPSEVSQNHFYFKRITIANIRYSIKQLLRNNAYNNKEKGGKQCKLSKKQKIENTAVLSRVEETSDNTTDTDKGTGNGQQYHCLHFFPN